MLLQGGIDIPQNYPTGMTFHDLLCALQEAHCRELEELRRTLATKIESEPVQVEVPVRCQTSIEIPDHGAHAELCKKSSHVAIASDEVGMEVEPETNKAESVQTQIARSVTFLTPASDKPAMEKDQSGPKASQKRSLLQTPKINNHGRIIECHVKKMEAQGFRKEATYFDTDLPVFKNLTPRSFENFVTHNVYFESFCIFMILLNAIFLAICISQELHWQVDGGTNIAFADELNYLFFAWFLIELILRKLSVGLYAFFFASSMAKWNIFDCIIVSVDIVQLVISHTIDEGRHRTSVTVLRVLRVCRVGRAFRVLRLMSAFTTLRLMILSFMMSGIDLLWCMFFMALFFYVYGMLMMDYLISHCEQSKPSDVDIAELTRWFGSWPKIFYTMFLAISGGVSWIEIAEPLMRIHWTAVLLFCWFIFFMMFAYMNVITSIFVQQAMDTAQNDKAEVIQERLNSNKSTLGRLRSIFSKADKDTDGLLALQDFEKAMTDDSNHALMSALGLEIHEARDLFILMDTDSSGQVSIDEFLIGCMRLKGDAQTVDIVTMMLESKKLGHLLCKIRKEIDVGFASLREQACEDWSEKHNGIALQHQNNSGLSTYVANTSSEKEAASMTLREAAACPTPASDVIKVTI